ncbi:uncharacterized protein BXZ73DRAFT_48710 [Epithele typhae]|uniref:uncharacterized protein n=1 Tax=Epithele typhae TaxID=378194 RepID=UPI0020082C0C|nr:uncharacterized protein BXZ73DRAFT_48710 [Epithele typhae]KAH9927908.1 hypothetical protein BXZ73DRAFT_48710 [Epithele typhae]
MFLLCVHCSSLRPPCRRDDNLFITSATVILIYEYVITFDREVLLFWSRRLSPASMLFFVNRYLPLIGNLMSIFSNIQMSDEVNVCRLGSNHGHDCNLTPAFSCTRYMQVASAFDILNLVPSAIFSCLRTFALTRSKPLAGLVLALSIVPFGLNMSQYGFNIRGLDDSLIGCTNILTRVAHVFSTVVIISRSCTIISDAILIWVTWKTLPRQGLAFATHIKGSVPSFSSILMINGTIYFAVLLILNVLHLAFTLSSVFNNPGALTSNLSQFTLPLTAVLISRFLMGLQEANRATVRVGAVSGDDALAMSMTSAVVWAGDPACSSVAPRREPGPNDTGGAEADKSLGRSEVEQDATGQRRERHRG